MEPVTLAAVLQELRGNIAQCESLIVTAHQADAAGTPIFSEIDRSQITAAAFLNMFLAWEAFLEASLGELMIGSPTISGTAPIKYVSPVNIGAAQGIVVGAMRFFDYANHDNVRKLVNLYFERGYPYEPHISAILSDLADLRTLRNATAHVTSTTQTALEALALRIFGKPMVGTDVYSVLTAVDPRSTAGDTVFATYKGKLLIAQYNT